MARVPGFIGPSYTVRSKLANVERTVNLYPEVVEDGHGKNSAWLMGTPGLTAWAQVGTGPIRAMFYQNNRGFVVSGFEYYELLANRTSILRGHVGSDGNPATIHTNGTAGFQNYIVSAGNGYIHTLNTNTFAQISDADFPSGSALLGFFLDGYFGVVIANSTTFRISNLLDGTAWDGLDVAQRSWASDNIVSAITNHRELWLLGSQTSEVWVDTGDTFPFAPQAGVFIEGGSGATFSAAQLDNTIFWLDGDTRGNRVVRRANGYTPERVSTHGVEFRLDEYEKVDDAVAFTYTEEGHAFYCLYLPTADVTWTYDAATRQWHERADWNPDTMRFEPWTPRAQMFAWGKHLVGDRVSGVVYEMRLDTYQDTVVVP